MISFNGDGGRNIREEGVVSPFEKLIYQHHMGLINTLPQGVCEFVDEGMRSTLLLLVCANCAGCGNNSDLC